MFRATKSEITLEYPSLAAIIRARHGSLLLVY
jgi:hypothetical protein